MAYIRAISGPDRVTPVGKLMGLDGTRSEAEGYTWDQLVYDWRIIQAPSGDPRVFSYPQNPGDSVVFDDGPVIWSGAGLPTVTFTGGSTTAFFTSAGPPMIPAIIGENDILEVTAGPNTGRYIILGLNHTTGEVLLDSPASAGEVNSTWDVHDDLATRINLTFTPGDLAAGDTVVVGGYYSFVTGVHAGGAWIDISPGLPFALQTMDFLAVIPRSIFSTVAGVLSCVLPYASFVPLVQGVYVVRLVVTSPLVETSEDFSAISAVAANVPLGLPLDASWVWQYLSDYWRGVDGKQWMETTWREAIRHTAAMLQEMWNVQADSCLATAQDVTMSRWCSYDAALPEPQPELATLERRFRVVYSDGDGGGGGLPAVMAGVETISIWVYAALTPTLVKVDAVGGETREAWIARIGLALAAAGYPEIRARGEYLDSRYPSKIYLTLRSPTYVITVTGTYHPGAVFMTNRFQGFGYLDATNIFRLSRYYNDTAPSQAAYDVDRVIQVGDPINIGGTNYTVKAVGVKRNLTPEDYPVTYVEFEPPLTAIDLSGGPVKLAYALPSFFRSAGVNFRDELVTPGDTAILFVDHDGFREETEVEVICSSPFRLGINDPSLFYRGWTTSLKQVQRRYYVPVDERVLSVPQLKEEPEKLEGWLEYVNYVVSERWDRRCLVFQFETEYPDGTYPTNPVTPTLTRKLTSPAWYPPDRYWAEISYIDRRPELDIRFGENFGLRLAEAPTRPGFSYQKALLGLHYCYLHGSEPHNIEKGLSIILGAAFFEEDGTILSDQPLAAGKRMLLVADAKDTEIIRSYIYNGALGLAVNPHTNVTYAIGDEVQQFEPVTDSATYRDYLSDPDFIALLIAGDIIKEPQKYHAFHVAVDARALDPHDVAAIRAAARFLLKFRTIYNYPFFALAARFVADIELGADLNLKVSLLLDSYLGSRWGSPIWSRAQLSGSGVHSHMSYILTSDEHFAAVVVDAGATARVYFYHTDETGAPDMTKPLDPERWGITARVPGEFEGIIVVANTGVWTEEDIDTVVPGPWPAAGYIESVAMLPYIGTTLTTFGVAGKPHWGFLAAIGYLRNHVKIRVLDHLGAELSSTVVADYPGPEQHGEPIP